MGKPDEFKITFTNNKRVYYAGDMVTGNVITKSRKKLKFRSIRMEFLGEAKVARANSKDWATVQNYFDEKVEIYDKGTGQNGSYPTIEAGDHAFPFHFEIPQRRLPSSFEGKFGCIRYTLKATMDRPWKSNYNSKCAITILEVVDINESWALEPVIRELEMHAQFMCFNRGSVVAQIKTDRRGYCPASKKSEINKCVKVSKDKRLRPHEPVQWENQMFSLPAIPPTINNCKFIKVSYSLEICVESRRGSLVISLPITVGTVPYRAPVIASAPPMTSPVYPLPSAPPSDLAPPGYQVNLPSYSETMAMSQLGPPPAYAECVLGSARIWDANDAASGAVLGDTSFTPMYAFVSNYEFRPATASAFTEEEITVEREPRLDAVDDGLSDSMDEQSD
ncbi:arrestin domain-containing protein 17-like isoform X2 [Dendronephthya gigantea]|uniref:arrestin domain-containing protein 17-like isoform X2 n=1 Tax=Dendronephthya gigantea TaxID=151771 RepID=UPI00106CCFA4|nr:arrestin domain-containing protein 17-like isoform X2 [Dendronephthya gigantea]